MRPPQPPTTYPSSELYCCNGLARSRCRRRHHDARQRRPPARVRHHTSDAKPPLLHAAKSRRQEYVERNTAPPKGRQHTPTPHLQTLPSDPNVLGVASRKVTVHGAPPTPDPHRILGFHPDMGWRGEMVPSATPPRRKAAPKIGVAAAGQPKAAKVSPGHRSAPPEHTGGGSGKIQTEPGTGKGCMEGRGAIPPDLARLRLAVLTAEPTGTPHATRCAAPDR